MSNGKTRVTLDLSERDYGLLEELERCRQQPTKAATLRSILRRAVAIERLGPDPDPGALKAVVTAP